MIASTTACLAASRFGLAPSSRMGTTAGNGLKLTARPVDAITNDPSG